MSIIRNGNVVLSNYRDAHVDQPILRNDHVSCHHISVMSQSPKNVYVAMSILGVESISGRVKLGQGMATNGIRT